MIFLITQSHNSIPSLAIAFRNVYNEKLPHLLRKFKEFNSRVFGFSEITGAILQAWFHWDNKLFTGIELKKQEVD
jgi:hypothetical protein